jgi:hypothetical protein
VTFPNVERDVQVSMQKAPAHKLAGRIALYKAARLRMHRYLRFGHPAAHHLIQPSALHSLLLNQFQRTPVSARSVCRPALTDGNPEESIPALVVRSHSTSKSGATARRNTSRTLRCLRTKRLVGHFLFQYMEVDGRWTFLVSVQPKKLATSARPRVRLPETPSARAIQTLTQSSAEAFEGPPLLRTVFRASIWVLPRPFHLSVCLLTPVMRDPQ